MSAEDLPFDKTADAQRHCPICGKPATATMAPFCSKRCADVDLHRWLGGVYVVPDDDPGQSDVTPDEAEGS